VINQQSINQSVLSFQEHAHNTEIDRQTEAEIVKKNNINTAFMQSTDRL